MASGFGNSCRCKKRIDGNCVEFLKELEVVEKAREREDDLPLDYGYVYDNCDQAAENICDDDCYEKPSF